MSIRSGPARPGRTSLEDVLKIGYALNGVSVGARQKSTPQQSLEGERTQKSVPDKPEPKKPRRLTPENDDEEKFVRVANAVEPFTTEVAEVLFEEYMQTLLKEDLSEAEVEATLNSLETMCKLSKLFHAICKSANRWTSVMNKKSVEYQKWGPAMYYDGDEVDFNDFCAITAVRMLGIHLYEHWALKTRLHYMAAIFGMKHNLKKTYLKNSAQAKQFVDVKHLQYPVVDNTFTTYAVEHRVDIVPPGMDLSSHVDEIRENVTVMNKTIAREVKTLLKLNFRRFVTGANKSDIDAFVASALETVGTIVAPVLVMQLIYTSFHDRTAPLARRFESADERLWTEDGNLRKDLPAQKDEYDAYAQEICLHVMRLKLMLGSLIEAHVGKVSHAAFLDDYLMGLDLSRLDMKIDYEDFSFNVVDHYDAMAKLNRAGRRAKGYNGMTKSYVTV